MINFYITLNVLKTLTGNDKLKFENMPKHNSQQSS